MITTYLCGGINGLTDAECANWRDTAKSQLGTATLDPMRRDYRGREDDFVSEIVLGDIEDIRQASFVLVNAERPSWGTAMEIVYAHFIGKPIIAFVGESRVSPWLRYHAKVVRSLEEAVSIINRSAG